MTSLNRAALALVVPAWLLAVPVLAQPTQDAGGRGETRGSGGSPSAAPAPSAPAPSSGGGGGGGSTTGNGSGGGSTSSGGGGGYRSSGDSGGRNHGGNGASGVAVQRGGDRGGERGGGNRGGDSGGTRMNGGATNGGSRAGSGAAGTTGNAAAGSNGGSTATGRNGSGERGRAVPRDGSTPGRSQDDTPGTGAATGVPPGARPRDGAPVTGTAVPRTTAPPSGGSGGVYAPGYYGGYYGGYYDPWWYGAGAYGGYYGGYYDPWYGSYPDAAPQVSGTYRDEGALRLKIKPREAEVYVDGYYVGIVDDFDGLFQKLHIETGAHRVEVRAPGYEPLVFDIRISPDHSTTYQGELKKIQ